MSKRFLSLLDRSISLSRVLLHRAMLLESGGRQYFKKTTTRRHLSRALSVLLFTCMSLVMMGSNGCVSCNQSPGNKDTPEDDQVGHTLAGLFLGLAGLGGHVKPMVVTGTDGSQMGTASFLGNFTAITQASGNYFLLMRTADCSLDQFTGTSTLTGSFDFTGYTTNYERTLHQAASLTTTPDVFPHGCVDNSVGVSSRVAVALPRKANSTVVLATAQNNGSNNAVFILSSSADLSTINFVQLPGLTTASALATADFNGDGNGDLVVVNDSNASSAYVSVVLGNGDGTFKSAINYPIAGNMSVAAVIDDVNNDGKLDIIAVSDTQQISILLGNGDGTFQTAQSSAAPALPGYSSAANTPILGLITSDVNNDGKKDIVCSNGLVLLGTGTGTFNAVSTPAFPYSASNPGGLGPGLAGGDLNNDGKPDLVLDTGSTISIYLGKGDGTFTFGASYGSISNSGYVTITDLDGDGNLDIYTGLAGLGIYSGDDNNYAAAYALMGNGDGTFVGAPAALGNYNGNNLGDVNGDGFPDLVSNATGQYNQTLAPFTVQLGTGKGSFTSASTITAPASFTGTTSALTEPVTITNANTVAATSYAVADINGDGKADLVFVDNGLTALNPGNGFPITYPAPIYFVALSNGDGTFAAPVPYNFPQLAPASSYDGSVTATTVQIADFNHDGHPDLLFTYNEQGGGPGTVPYNQGFAIITGNGDGTFSTTPILTSTYSSTSAPTTAFVATVLSTADLNGDGKPDLIVNAPGTVITNFQLQTATQIYIGNGDGTFKTPTTIPADDEYGIPVAVDFNKDGKLDLAFIAESSASQAELIIALGNGDGTFATPTVLNLSGGDAIRSSAIAAADFDNDGNIDLVLLDSNDFSGVFYGKGDGTFTSVPFGGNIIPKDLINLAVGGTTTAVDLNKDGKPDILAGGTVLLNLYGSAPIITPTQASTTIAVTALPSGSVVAGTSVTFTATLTPGASSSMPSGTVTFFDGTTTLGTGTVASNVATYSTSTLGAGSHSITATYAGDTNFTGSTSPAVSLTVTGSVISTTTALSASATSAVSGTSLIFTAQVTPASGTAIPTGSVTFTDGSTSLGNISLDGTGKATYTTSTLAVGSHTITAAYGGAAGFAASTSSNLGVTITAPPIPDFAISVSPTTSTVTHGSSITTTLSITPANGFNQATTLTCSGAPAGGTCTIAPTSVTPSGTAASTATVTLQTSASNSSLSNTHRNFALAVTLPLGLIGTTSLFGLGLGRRRRWPLLVTALVAFTALAAVTGCGHSSPPASTTFTKITPTLTLTGTSGSLTHSTTWTVTVQ